MVVQRPSGSLHRACHTTWPLASPRSEREKRGAGSVSASHDLILEGTCYHCCHILSVTQTSPGTRGKPTQDCECREAGTLGTILEAGEHKAHVLRPFLLLLKLLSGFPGQQIPFVFLLPQFFSLSSIQYVNFRLLFLKYIVDQIHQNSSSPPIRESCNQTQT